jgi:hypothetical protein
MMSLNGGGPAPTLERGLSALECMVTPAGRREGLTQCSGTDAGCATAQLWIPMKGRRRLFPGALCTGGLMAVSGCMVKDFILKRNAGLYAAPVYSQRRGASLKVQTLRGADYVGAQVTPL